MFKGRKFFIIVVILLLIEMKGLASNVNIPHGGRQVAVVIVDIVSIVDWLNSWSRLEGALRTGPWPELDGDVRKTFWYHELGEHPHHHSPI
jgi:hypothetical protein